LLVAQKNLKEKEYLKKDRKLVSWDKESQYLKGLGSRMRFKRGKYI
jgi:hypothetical protein